MNLTSKRTTLTALLTGAFGLALTFLPAAPAGAAEPESEPASAEAVPPQEETRKTEPERVEVTDSAPYLPTSNTIATRLPVLPRFTPWNLGTVNEPLLRDQYALVLGDALRNVSGVNVQTQSGVSDYFLIRGFDSLSSGLVLTDGALEPEVSFFQMYNVERVEVLKGPGGFLYGRNPLSGALAGTVNIVRQQPVPSDFLELGASAGSFGTYEGTVDYNQASGDGALAFRLNGLWRESDGYRDDKQSDTFAINPAFAWRLSERTAFHFNVEYLETDSMPDSGIPLYLGEIPDVARETSYQSPFDSSQQRVGRFQVDFETELSDHWTVRDKLYFRGLDWESSGTVFNGVFPTGPGGAPEVSRTLTVLDDRQEFAGNQFEALLTGNTGSVQHKLLMGVEVAQYTDNFTIGVSGPPAFGGLANLDLFNPSEPNSPDPVVFPFSSGDSTSTVVAPYVIDQATFTDWFQALAGARFDSLDYEETVSGADERDSNVSPMLGLVFIPADQVTLYANAGRSFGPPPPRVSGNPDPEEGEQVEAGVKLNFKTCGIQATLAGYQVDRQNIGIPDDNGVTQQAGDQRSRGIEIEFAAEPIPRLRTFLSYALNDAELTEFSESVIIGFDIFGQPVFGTVDRSGNVPAFAPRHILNFWVSHRFENGLGVAGGARYVSGQFIAEDNSFEIDDYITVDAAVYYAINRLELNLNFKNLTDAEYETRGFGSASVLPAAPRSVYGGVSYRF